MAGPRKKNVGIEKKKRVSNFMMTMKEMRQLRNGKVDDSLDKMFGKEKYARPKIRWSAWY